MVMADVAIALGIITLVVAPLTHSWVKEHRLMRGLYQRSIAMQIVDGEAEILAAGNWVTVPTGRHPYRIKADARHNLTTGEFISTRSAISLKLEWIPGERGYGGTVTRTVKLPSLKQKGGAQ